MDRTRRGILGLLAATTGCLGFGGDNEVTPGQVTDSPSSPTEPPVTETPTASPTPTGTETPTLSPTETQTATDTPTASPTASPTPTPTARDAQAPPPGSLDLLRTSVNVLPSSPPSASVSATLRNTGRGDAQFTLIELRFDLQYRNPATGQLRTVAVAYAEQYFEDSAFGGGTETIGSRLDLSDSGLDGDEPEADFSLDVAFRRVQYR